MSNVAPFARIIAGICTFSVLIAATGCTNADPPKSGEAARSISCTDVKGEYFSLGHLKGQVVVIYFWSSKCCGDSLKQLQPFYLDYKDRGVSLVAVEVGGAKDAIASFVASNKLGFTNLTDDYGGISQSYRVVGYPTIFIVDKKGYIQRKVSGEIAVDQLGKLVDQSL